MGPQRKRENVNSGKTNECYRRRREEKGLVRVFTTEQRNMGTNFVGGKGVLLGD